MNKLKLSYLFALALLITLGSCSLVKNSTSSNFSRVKYNAHLKLPNAKNEVKLPKTVESFASESAKKENSEIEQQITLVASKSNKVEREPVQSKKKEEQLDASATKAVEVDLIKSPKALLEEMKPVLSAPVVRKRVGFHDHWWEDDPEDWPWGEIILAVIAVFLIAIIIVVLVDLIGGIIAGLFGLILLLALGYCLYYFWLA